MFLLPRCGRRSGETEIDRHRLRDSEGRDMKQTEGGETGRHTQRQRDID